MQGPLGPITLTAPLPAQQPSGQLTLGRARCESAALCCSRPAQHNVLRMMQACTPSLSPIAEVHCWSVTSTAKASQACSNAHVSSHKGCSGSSSSFVHSLNDLTQAPSMHAGSRQGRAQLACPTCQAARASALVQASPALLQLAASQAKRLTSASGHILQPPFPLAWQPSLCCLSARPVA